MEENKFLILFRQHWSKAIIGILCMACIAAWSERLFKSKSTKTGFDFIVANKIFEKLQKGDILTTEAIGNLEEILKKHPELHARFDALLSIAFISQHNAVKAISYARAALNQVEDTLSPFYQDYARTSLLIIDDKYATAFGHASLLNTALENHPEFETLYAMNLLRLVFLAEKLTLFEDRNQLWEKFKTHSKNESIKNLFKDGSMTLEDYMKERHLKI